MSTEINLLIVTAASIGFIHTLIGPDHYLPFIMMSKARKWPLSRTIGITFVCGIGHVLSSVVLGFLGIGFGIAVAELEAIEGFRGNLAAWGLIAFGTVYAIWGLRRTLKQHTHAHTHISGRLAGLTHVHSHDPNLTHEHSHARSTNITPWILFTVFVLGPCEPLIPILMYPAAQNDLVGVITVTSIFGFVTILTMITLVAASAYGLRFLPLGKLERFSHVIAGSTIAISGLAIQFLGL